MDTSIIISFECNKLIFNVSNDFIGERIFRVGSVRYKMDSTKRTLQRISGGPFLMSLLNDDL